MPPSLVFPSLTETKTTLANYVTFSFTAQVPEIVRTGQEGLNTGSEHTNWNP